MGLKRTLKQWRALAGMTQSQLARTAGLAQSTVAHYESGRRVPSLNSARRLADALGILLDQIEWPERAKKGA